MTLTLSTPIAAYFAADRIGGDAVVECFADDAVVKDEGKSYRGRRAIKEWKLGSTKKYTYTSEPTGSEEKDGKTIITSRVSGNFPGSPLDLRYIFGLDRDRISSLEITL
jgi:hypothetical protein